MFRIPPHSITLSTNQRHLHFDGGSKLRIDSNIMEAAPV